jgi:hypothetical protein
MFPMREKIILITLIITTLLAAGCGSLREEEAAEWRAPHWDQLSAVATFVLRRNDTEYLSPGSIVRSPAEARRLFADLHAEWGSDMLFRIESATTSRFRPGSWPAELLAAVEQPQGGLAAPLPFVPDCAICWYDWKEPADPATLPVERLGDPRVVLLCDRMTGAFMCGGTGGWSDRRAMSSRQLEMLGKILASR